MSNESIVAAIVCGQFVLIAGWFALIHWLDRRRRRRGQ